MAKNISISDELHQWILDHRIDGSTMDSTLKRLLDIDEFRGQMIKKYSHRARLMPQEGFNWTILNALQENEHLFDQSGSENEVQDALYREMVSAMGVSSGLTTAELQQSMQSYIEANNLLTIYASEAEIVSRRPRWKIRFTSALRQLRKDGYIRLHLVDGVGVNTITSKGVEVMEGVTLGVDPDDNEISLEVQQCLGDEVARISPKITSHPLMEKQRGPKKSIEEDGYGFQHK